MGPSHYAPAPCKWRLCGGRQAAARSGRWHINCWRQDKLSGDLISQPKRPGDLDIWPIDLESGVRVTCDVGNFCANFTVHRPLCSRLRPDVRDKQMSDVRRASSLNAACRRGGGIIMQLDAMAAYQTKAVNGSYLSSVFIRLHYLSLTL